MYRFSWHTPVLDGALRACHALELPFLFERLDQARVLVGDDPPVDLACDLHDAWVRFATVGDPDGGGLPSWPTFEPERRPVMDFGAARRVVDDPAGDERRVWEGLL
jgi:para-nitrobenzyl esterase